MLSRHVHAFLVVVLLFFCLLAPLAAHQQKRTKPDSSTAGTAETSTTPTSSSTPTGSYYDLLEVTKDATEAEIKKNYRKLALIHHPDKASNDAEKEEKQQIFVKLANAYEILSEPRTRTRYDYLLSIGQLEYEYRDWSQFDAEHGYQPIISAEHRRQKAEHDEQLRRAYEQFKAAEEVRETFALWAALIGGGLVASVPLIWQWRQRSVRDRSRRSADTQARHRLREEQEIVKELRAQQEAEAAEIAEENRLRAAELRDLRAQQADEDDNDDEEEERPTDQVDENGEQGDEEQEQDRRNKKKGSSTVLKCELCNKKFKSANQLENHNQSAAHKKAERTAEIEAKRAARKK